MYKAYCGPSDLGRRAEALEKSVERVRCAIDRAPQAILQKAFAGELVPTEAELAADEGREFESADALLSRVTVTQSETGPTSSPPQRCTRPRRRVAAGLT
jgi:hypothetical protein